jgi:hypothetical protein
MAPRAARRRAPRCHGLDRSSSLLASAWSDRCKGPTAVRTLAEDRQACNGAQPGIAAGTRCSCTVPCKEQARNRGTRPAVVFYSRGLRSPLVPPPQGFALSSPQKCSASGRSHRRNKNPRRRPARATGAVLMSTPFSKILVTRVNRKNATRADYRLLKRRGECDEPSYRKHSMATNSSRAELPVVASSAPAISCRSTLRKDAASA